MNLTSAALITHPPASRWGVCFGPVLLIAVLAPFVIRPVQEVYLA